MKTKVWWDQDYQKQLEFILSHAVGFQTEVYWGSGIGLGIGEKKDYYQIMPSTHVEGKSKKIRNFWDWHMEHNPQWFETPLDAAVGFLDSWARFNKDGVTADKWGIKLKGVR